jgi:hypothetical protein
MTNAKNEGLYDLAYDRLELSLQMLEEFTKELRGFSTRYNRKRDKKINEGLNKFENLVLSEILEFSRTTEKSLNEIFEPDFLSELVEETLYQIIPVSFGFDVFIRDMSLVYLIAEFDSFLANILRDTFKARPEAYASTKKCLTNEELLKSDNIENIKNAVIEMEIAEALRLDIEDLGKYFEDKFKVKINKLPKWTSFKERFYRRNIIVHNSGIINDVYRQKTGYKGCSERLIVSEEYLSESIDLFRAFGRNIMIKFHRKFIK